MIGLGLGLGLSASMGASGPTPPPFAIDLVADYNPDTGYVVGTSWADQSGAGNNLTMTGTSAGTALNGHATVAVAAGESGTIAALSGVTGGAISMAIVLKNLASATSVAVAYNITNQHSLYSYFGGSPYYINGGAALNGGADITGAFHRLVSTDSGSGAGSVQIYRDGVAAAGANGTNPVTSGKSLTIGGGNFAATVARILVWKRALFGAEAGQVDSFLASMYGL